LAGRISYCGELLRGGDHDRFLTALFSSAATREPLFTLYAFNLEIARIRDHVKEPLLGEMRLQWWREGIAGIFSSQSCPDHPVLQALGEAIAVFDLPRQRFEIMLDARSADFSSQPHATLDALETYADAVSAGLMRLAALLLERARPGDGFPIHIQDAAFHHAGAGYMLAGLLRSIAFHGARGQICLPADVMRVEGVSPDMLLAGKMRPEIGRMIERLSGRAEMHIQRARHLLPRIPRDILPVFLPVTLAELYLKALRLCRHDPFQPPSPIPVHRKQLRLFRAWLGRRF
jgi:phytoene/squalene synthetase